MYDSNIWSSASGSWQPTNVSNSTGTSNSMAGWRLVTSGDSGSVTNLYQDCYWYGFLYTDPQGTQHSFSSVQTEIYDGIFCNGTNTPSWGAFATDGTGYYMAVTGYFHPTVYGPDGTQVYPSVKDPNGNYYSTDGNGNIVDTLGRTMVTTSASGNTITYSVLNSQGTRSNYVVTTEPVYVSTSFGDGHTEYSGTITGVSSIGLPDGTAYSFQYNSGFSPGFYGQLTGMRLPTGGNISYQYQTIYDAYSQASSIIWKRTTPDSGSSSWTYSLQPISHCASGQQNCEQSVSVTKPSTGFSYDSTTYTFAMNGGAWPIQSQTYDHSAGVLSTSNICYSFENLSPVGKYPSCALGTWGGPPAFFVYRMSTTTTVPIPGANVTTATAYQWDNGNNGSANLALPNITQISEWNFGNTSNSADRTTAISYLGGPSTPYYTAPGRSPLR
jgi:hypothetical protein